MLKGFGKRLKKRMEEQGFTVERFAQELGVTNGSVANWRSEKKTPEKWRWKAISAKLNTTVSQLFFDEIVKKDDDERILRLFRGLSEKKQKGVIAIIEANLEIPTELKSASPDQLLISRLQMQIEEFLNYVEDKMQAEGLQYGQTKHTLDELSDQLLPVVALLKKVSAQVASVEVQKPADVDKSASKASD